MSRISSHTLHVHHDAHIHAKPKVLVAVADGTEELEAVTTIDTLVRGGAEVTVGSVMASLQVTCSRGVKLCADRHIRDCKTDSWSMIVVPGGMPGAEHLSESEDLIEILQRQHEEGKYIAAICAAPAVVLARHRLLHGRRATCYPVEKFTSKLSHFDHEHVVVDGSLITSQGPGTALSFALKLVEVLFGHEKSSTLKKEMIVV
jgi:4-methyl-5(b-hydroxyethyl)-thiazole monophosphate biosynthesis